MHEIVSNLGNHAQVTFIGDATRTERLVQALSAQNLDYQGVVAAGELRLLSVEESYLISGGFSGGRAAAFVE